MQLPNRLADGTPYLSPSAVKTFLDCPEAWRYKYVVKLREPEGIAATFGKVVHEALASGLAHLKATGTRKPSDVVGTAAHDLLHGLINDDKFVQSLRSQDRDRKELEPQPMEAARATKLAWEFLTKQNVEPIDIETEIVKRYDGWALKGYLDYSGRVNGETILGDFKTVDRMPDGGRARRGDIFQVVSYGDAVPYPVSAALVVYIIRSKEPRLHATRVPFNAKSVAWARHIANSVRRSIEADIFTPNPMSWRCKPTICTAWSQCLAAPRHEVEA